MGRPVKMARENPSMGSLVLLLSPIRRQVRLAMSTGGQDEHAVVMNSSAALAGFMRYGHMLEPYFGPVARRLGIETGKVEAGEAGRADSRVEPRIVRRKRRTRCCWAAGRSGWIRSMPIRRRSGQELPQG